MTTVKVAAAQIRPALFSLDGSLQRVLDAMAEAAAQGVELIVFPETFLPYYPYFSFVEPPVLMGRSHLALYEQAVVVPGPVTDAVAAAARQYGMQVLLGVNERDGGTLYNTQLLFNSCGELVLKRRKIHADLSRADGLGPRGRLRSQGGADAVGSCRRSRLLGALQPLSPLRLDGPGGGDPLRSVPGLIGGPDLLGTDRRHHAPSRP